MVRRIGVSRLAVGRWKRRYGATRGGRRRSAARKDPSAQNATLFDGRVAQMLLLTCSDPPGEVSHWTGCAVAHAVGIPLRAVQRIRDAHRIEPH